MARRTRAAKKAQEEDSSHPQASQEASSASTQPSTSKTVDAEPGESRASASPKGKAKQVAERHADDSQQADADAATQPQDSTPPTSNKQTMEERKERMAALRKKMVSGTRRLYLFLAATHHI